MALYELLMRISDNPMVALNHAVAVAMVTGRRRPGSTCSASSRPTSGSPATTGCTRSARTCWRWPATTRRRARRYLEAAAARTTSFPQQRYLHARAARLPADSPAADPSVIDRSAGDPDGGPAGG